MCYPLKIKTIIIIFIIIIIMSSALIQGSYSSKKRAEVLLCNYRPLFTASERSISVNDRRKAGSIKGVSLLAKDSETHSSAYETKIQAERSSNWDNNLIEVRI